MLKALEKQIKTVEDQEEKQIKVIEDYKKQLDNKNELSNTELFFSRETEILQNTYSKRLEKIDKLSKKIDYGDLNFIVNSSGLETNFIEL